MNGFDLEIISVEGQGGMPYHSYLLDTKSLVIVIDTGIDMMRGRFEELLKKRDLEAKRLLVLNTHGHWDHIALNGWLKKKYGAVIMAHPGDGWIMNDFDTALEVAYKKHQNLFPLTKEFLEFISKNLSYPKGPDETLADGDTVEDEDFCLRVVATPGHSEGSVSFFEENTRTLFSGDALQGNGQNGNAPYYNDAESYLQSVDILDALQPENIYQGHRITEGREACQTLIDESREACVFIDEYLAEHYGGKAESLQTVAESLAALRGWKNGMHLASSIDAHKPFSIEPTSLKEPEPEPEPAAGPEFSFDAPPIPSFDDFSFDAPPVPSFDDFSFDAPPIPSFDAPDAPPVPSFDDFSFDDMPPIPSFDDTGEQDDK